MSTPLLQLNHYFGIRQQPLRRVLIYAPTLIWVQQGRKQLWWRGQRLSFDKEGWVVVPAGHRLTFGHQMPKTHGVTNEHNDHPRP